MAAKPVSPQAYRGGLFDQVDVPALVCLALSAAGFLSLVLLIRAQPEQVAEPLQNLDDISDRMARILMPLRPAGSPPVARPMPSPPRPAPATAQSRGALARVERSRQKLNATIEEAARQVSRTSVLSILSSTRSGRRGTGGRGGVSMGFADLDKRLSSLGGITRYEERATPGGAGEETGIKADPHFRNFATARAGTAAKIGSLEFERPQLLGGGMRQAGGRQLQTLSATISRQQTSIRLLYEERLKIDPTLEGKVTVALVIEEDGRVSAARIIAEETTLGDVEFQNEILRRVRRWTFPPFQGGSVELKSPFVFKPL